MFLYFYIFFKYHVPAYRKLLFPTLHFYEALYSFFDDSYATDVMFSPFCIVPGFHLCQFTLRNATMHIADFISISNQHVRHVFSFFLPNVL